MFLKPTVPTEGKKNFLFDASNLYIVTVRESETTLQDVKTKLPNQQIEVQVSSSLPIFSSVNCNLQTLILGHIHFMVRLGMAYSWPSKEGAGSFLILRGKKKKIYLQKRKSKEPSKQPVPPPAARRGGQ